MFDSDSDPDFPPDYDADAHAERAEFEQAQQAAWLEQWQAVWTPAALVADAAADSAGVGLLNTLVQVDAEALTADDAVTFVQQCDRMAAFVAGLQIWARKVAGDALVSEFESSNFVAESDLAVAELAAACRVSPDTMSARVTEAIDLDGPWLPLRDALLLAKISPEHVRAIARVLRHAPGYGNAEHAAAYGAMCAKVLRKVIPYAATHSPGLAARKTRLLVAAFDPAGARRARQEAAERDHGVFIGESSPGTSVITAVLPTAYGEAVYSAIDALAHDDRFQTAAGCITVGQRRAAALVALTLGDPGSVGRLTGPVAEAKLRLDVQVVVPLATITALSDDAGLIGREPATADALIELLAAAHPASTLRRLVTDGVGTIIDAGRTRYSISDTQRRLVALRDKLCRFPGCSRRAERCEVDHARPWSAGGCTDLCNLGALCKHHHQLKTHAGWRIVRSRRSGACTWISPLGRIYEHTPLELLPTAT